MLTNDVVSFEQRAPGFEDNSENSFAHTPTKFTVTWPLIKDALMRSK